MTKLARTCLLLAVALLARNADAADAPRARSGVFPNETIWTFFESHPLAR